VLIVALRRVRWERRRRAMGHPWRLFYRLLRGLPVTWAQRWRLAQVARRVCPDSPAAILLTPSALDESIRRWGHGRPKAAREKMSARLAPVFETLFTTPPDESTG
jgi:hypothetical protein